MKSVAAAEQPAELSTARKAFNLFAISFAFLAVFANAAIPTPLQAEYRAAFGITDADLSFALAIYTLGEIGVLCFMGTLSDALGRKPLTLLAMGVGIASCLGFLAINGPVMLTIARTLQGIACGLTMSAIVVWGMATYFQSYASPVCADCFGIVMPLAASALMVVANAPTALGAPLESRFRSGVSARVAVTVFVLACTGMAATMQLSTFVPFLLFTALFAAAAGMCVAAGLRLLLARTDGLSSAKVVSTINLAGYVGTAVLSFLMSALVEDLGLVGVLLVLTLISAGAAVLVFAKTRQPK